LHHFIKFNLVKASTITRHGDEMRVRLHKSRLEQIAILMATLAGMSIGAGTLIVVEFFTVFQQISLIALIRTIVNWPGNFVWVDFYGRAGIFFTAGFLITSGLVCICVRGTQGRHKEVQPISEMPNVAASRLFETSAAFVFFNLKVVIFILSL